MIRYVAAGAISLVAPLSLCGFAAGGPYAPGSLIAGLLVVGLFIAAFITLVWRILLVGVWIGEQGIKVNMVLRTRRVRWPELDRVWVGPATGYDALALWISVRGGADIETPVWRAGTRAAHRNRMKLEQHELSSLMERLRAEGLRASRTPPGR